jgi:putative acetyltransferase
MRRLSPKLRAYEPHDLDDVFEIHSAPAVRDPTARLASDSRATLERAMVEPGEGRHVLVAEVPEARGRRKVVALAGLSIPRNPRVRHTATFFLAVHERWQGKGIGEALSREVLRLADEELGLLRVELQVHSTNDRAVRLYEKLGFQIEGRLRANILSHGEYIDSFVMGRVRAPRAFASAMDPDTSATRSHIDPDVRDEATERSPDAPRAARRGRARPARAVHRRR